MPERKNILSFYEEYDEDTRAVQSRADGLEFYFTKRLLDAYIRPDSNVIELGCGTGYYGMHFASRCARYTGIDLSERNIAAFREKIARAGIMNVTAEVGDALKILSFGGENYDAVLCLGPMYHAPHRERLRILLNCKRVAKDGAVLAFAYINAIGAYVGACVHDNLRKDYPSAEANENVLQTHTGYERPGVFYYTSPEEMEADAERAGLRVLTNRGLDFFFAQCAINDMTDEQFRHYMELHERMHESPSCTGLADHALLVCEK